jgi:hypothetical protein
MNQINNNGSFFGNNFYLRFKAKEMSKNYAGIGAIIARSLSYLQFHQTLLGQGEVEIRIPELRELFIFPKYPHKLANCLDLEALVLKSDFDDPTNAHRVNHPEEIRAKHSVFKKYFANPVTREYRINDEMDVSKTLGIHLRGTDKIGEVNPVSQYLLFKKIEERLESETIENIFLATDDEKYRRLLIERYGSKTVRFNPSVKVSPNGKPLHFGKNRSLMNKMVVEDIFSLSEVKHLLYSYSNVSYLALIAGFNTHAFVDCLHTRSTSVGD